MSPQNTQKYGMAPVTTMPCPMCRDMSATPPTKRHPNLSSWHGAWECGCGAAWSCEWISYVPVSGNQMGPEKWGVIVLRVGEMYSPSSETVIGGGP